MGRILFSLMVGALLTGGVHGAALEGRTIELTVGEHLASHVPVAVPYDGPAPEKTLYVVESGTGKRMPASVHDGQLVFVAEGGRPGTVHRYTVEAAGDARAPVVSVSKRDGEEAVEVRISDEFFTAYHYSNESKKPYLWPVLGKGGAGLTRDWPMGEATGTRDHPHQKSCWVAYGDLNGVDFWAEGGNSGYQHTEEVTWGSGDAFGWIKASNVWQDKDRKPIITEEREYRFYAGPEGARIFDAIITFRAEHGPVKWGDTKEGGLMAVRMADALRERGGSGTITNGAGGVGAGETWGKPAAWCDYSGTLLGFGTVGLAIFDHPENLRHPSHWHVRDYGLMGANCFGYSYFTNGEENGDWEMAEGDVQVFRYRVYVHAGDVEEARVADKYADYASTPVVRWVD